MNRRSSNRALLGTAFALVVAILLLTSVVPAKVMNQASAATKTTLKWGMLESIDSLNPFIGVNDNAYIFYGLVYDYLVAVDEDMKPKPNLALSWYVVPDQLPYGSVWQYNLSQNTKWHDGELFDADDVVFTINYQIGTNYDSMWAYQPYTILINSVEKVDTYTVRIHFKDIHDNPAPCPFGDKLMLPIVPEHIWSQITVGDAGFSYPNYWPIGTGPFMCTASTKDEYVSGSSMVLIKNPQYHGKADYNEEIKFDRLILEFYLEPSAMLTAMESGSIDVALFNAPNFVSLQDYLAAHPGAPIGTYSGLTCTAFSIDLEVNVRNSGPNILRLDPAVRKAMAYATDKDFIRDYIYKGYAEIGSAILTPIYGDLFWSPGPSEIYPFDLAKANETLDAAGYAWNSDHTIRVAAANNSWVPNGTLSFDIIIEAELVEDRDTSFFLKAEWAKVGIEINPVIVSTGQWNLIVYNYNYDLTISYWSGDPDPNYLLFIQTTYSIDGWSENSYSNPEYDENYTKCVETVDATERIQYIHNCQKIMYRDCAFMVTVYPYGCYAWRTDTFTGWGDWGAHPGRSLSNFWTANPLYFDLVPTGGGGGGGNLTYAYIGIGVAVAAAVAVALLLRKRGPKEEEVRLP